MKTIDVLIESAGVSLEQLAAVTELPVERVEAIVDGRWLPRPRSASCARCRTRSRSRRDQLGAYDEPAKCAVSPVWVERRFLERAAVGARLVILSGAKDLASPRDYRFFALLRMTMEITRAPTQSGRGSCSLAFIQSCLPLAAGWLIRRRSPSRRSRAIPGSAARTSPRRARRRRSPSPSA